MVRYGNWTRGTGLGCYGLRVGCSCSALGCGVLKYAMVLRKDLDPECVAMELQMCYGMWGTALRCGPMGYSHGLLRDRGY
eukprot:2732912-Rhodomonas_salina.2